MHNKPLCKHRYQLRLVCLPHKRSYMHTDIKLRHKEAGGQQPTHWAERPLHEYQHKCTGPPAVRNTKAFWKGRKIRNKLPYISWLDPAWWHQTRWGNTTILTLHSPRATNTPERPLLLFNLIVSCKQTCMSPFPCNKKQTNRLSCPHPSKQELAVFQRAHLLVGAPDPVCFSLLADAFEWQHDEAIASQLLPAPPLVT